MPPNRPEGIVQHTDTATPPHNDEGSSSPVFIDSSVPITLPSSGDISDGSHAPVQESDTAAARLLDNYTPPPPPAAPTLPEYVTPPSPQELDDGLAHPMDEDELEREMDAVVRAARAEGRNR